MNRAEEILAALPPGETEEARAALEWLVPAKGDLDDILQIQLEEFLWCHLPLEWAMPTRQLHEVAWALGDVFERAGKPRYAVLCRAVDTHLLLDAWQTDRGAARRRMRRLIDESGVSPIDTDLVAWGDVMGMQEFAASCTVSLALEEAIDSGDLHVGSRGWRNAAQQIVDSVVLRAGEQGEGTLLDGIERERADSWAGAGPPERASVMREVLPDVLRGKSCLRRTRWPRRSNRWPGSWASSATECG